MSSFTSLIAMTLPCLISRGADEGTSGIRSRHCLWTMDQGPISTPRSFPRIRSYNKRDYRKITIKALHQLVNCPAHLSLPPVHCGEGWRIPNNFSAQKTSSCFALPPCRSKSSTHLTRWSYANQRSRKNHRIQCGGQVRHAREWPDSS